MVEAEPVVLARTIESRPPFTGRAELARLITPGGGARAVTTRDAAMELVEPHGFHMGIEALEGKI
jgi:hypothetical protein